MIGHAQEAGLFRFQIGPLIATKRITKGPAEEFQLAVDLPVQLGQFGFMLTNNKIGLGMGLIEHAQAMPVATSQKIPIEFIDAFIELVFRRNMFHLHGQG